MIRTAENIIDPVEFFMQNQADIHERVQGSSTVITARDWDVMVEFTEKQTAIGHTVTEQDDVLGNITPKIAAFGIPTPHGFANLASYVSAQKVTDIQTNLGLEPGQDCLRHVSAPFDRIPPREYTEYFSGGMYPRSTIGGYNFEHDRKNNDHVLGALLMPKIFVKKLAEIAFFDLARTEQVKRYGRVLFASDADRATSGATECVLAAHQETQGVSETQTSSHWGRGRLGFSRLTYDMKEKQLQEVFRERISELVPAIEQLKQQSPTIDQLHNQLFKTD